MSDDSGFLPPHGNYAQLLSSQKAEIVYDITFRFCHKYLSKGDRTVDQMIQSARSGKKNILEGSKASITSLEPFSLARPAAMLISPDQPIATQAFPPAMSSIMVELNKRTSLRTLPNMAAASL